MAETIQMFGLPQIFEKNASGRVLFQGGFVAAEVLGARFIDARFVDARFVDAVPVVNALRVDDREISSTAAGF